MIVIGTSASVYPAADMPKRFWARIIGINQDVTPLTGFVSDYLIEGKQVKPCLRSFKK